MVAATAALVLTAAFAAASSSASTVLCKQAESPCATGNVLPKGSSLLTGVNHTFDPATKFTLKGSFFTNVSCNNGVLQIKTTAESGTPLAAEELNSGAWNCSNGEKGEPTCSTGLSSGPATIQQIFGYSGIISLGTTGQPLQVSYTCGPEGSRYTCTYSASGPILDGINYNEIGYTTGKISEVSLSLVSGSLCDSTVKLNAVTDLVEGGVISTH
jgi:hypothetical protein